MEFLSENTKHSPFTLDESQGSYFIGNDSTEKFVKGVADDIVNCFYNHTDSKNTPKDWSEMYRGSLIKYTNERYNIHLMRYDETNLDWVHTVDVIIVNNIDDSDNEFFGAALIGNEKLEYGTTKIKHCGILIKNPINDKRRLMGVVGHELKHFFVDFSRYKNKHKMIKMQNDMTTALSTRSEIYILQNWTETDYENFRDSLNTNDYLISLYRAFFTLCYYLNDDEILSYSENIYVDLLYYSKTHETFDINEFVEYSETYRVYDYIERMLDVIYKLSDKKSETFIDNYGYYVQDAFRVMEDYDDDELFMRSCRDLTITTREVKQLTLKKLVKKLDTKLAYFEKHINKQWYYLKEK